MRKCYFALLAIFLCKPTAPVAAQTPQVAPQVATQQAQSSQPSRPPALATIIKKTVGLLRVSFLSEEGPKTAEGTCFFVWYGDKRGGENFGFTYLVTNRHMATPGVEKGKNYPVLSTHIRLNLRNSDEGPEENLPVPPMQWFFPTDDSVDLAVLPLRPNQTKYDYVQIPLSEFATHDVVDKEQVAEGDHVLFTGYFYQFPGLRKFQPIVREGILAMMPDEKLETTLHKPGHLYLADVHVFGGNSGSPLLVNLAGWRTGAVVVGTHYELLGIISGFYHEDSNLNLTVSTTLTATLEQNSGIAMVVPADELRALLDIPALQAARDAQIPAKQPSK